MKTANILGLISLFLPLAASEPLAKGIYAELNTSKGAILLRLEFQKTPMTVANFVGLAEGTIQNRSLPPGKPYFDGTVFHRVVPGHVIQAGKPGGTDLEGPGYEIPNEIYPALHHDRAGILGMANAGPHTGGSQFYITLDDRSYLDGNYSVFGSVVSGMDVVQKIVQSDIIEKVAIMRIGPDARSFKTDNASFLKLLQKTKTRVEKMEKRRRDEEESLIRKRWPQAAAIKPGLRSLILREGAGNAPAAGAILQVRYRGELLDGRKFASQADGKPAPGMEPEPFAYILGSTAITPGIDLALSLMKKGEKRLLILLPEHGYGKSGFHGKTEPGKKRFVISPNSTLVIELERL